MIKITIIIILILLLLITLYSYYCLSSRMIDFERSRLEYILQKETEVNIKESKVKQITNCSNKNEQYQSALANINKILGTVNIGCESVNSEVNNRNSDIIKGIQNVITGKVNPSIAADPVNNKYCNNIAQSEMNNNDINSLISKESINVELLNEVPSEYIN